MPVKHLLDAVWAGLRKLREGSGTEVVGMGHPAVGLEAVPLTGAL